LWWIDELSLIQNFNLFYVFINMTLANYLIKTKIQKLISIMKNKVQNFLHFHSGLNIPALILLLFLLSDPIGHRCWNPDYIPLFLAYLID